MKSLYRCTIDLNPKTPKPETLGFAGQGLESNCQDSFEIDRLDVPGQQAHSAKLHVTSLTTPKLKSNVGALVVSTQKLGACYSRRSV